MKKRILSAALALTMGIGLFSGCVSVDTGDSGSGSASETLEKVTTSDQYPIETDVELTWWVGLNANVAATAGSMNETEFARLLQEKTGVKVKFIHPTAGQESEQFNLLIASGELPDIIETNWSRDAGGPEKAIKDKVILPLNDYIDKVSPNFKKFLEENPDLDAQLKTDSGKYFMYPMVKKDRQLRSFMGFMVREDLLKRAGLDKPETIDEWEVMLRKFKEMGIKTPLTMSITNDYQELTSLLMGAFGIKGGLYVKDGKVKFGENEPEYRKFLETMSRWYNEGLLDKEFVDQDAKRLSAMVVNGEVGAIIGYNGADFGKWIPTLEQNVPGATFTPVAYPTQVKGETPMAGQLANPIDGIGAVITPSCKHPEIAARLLDFGYSEAGHMLYNFGEEGVSYEMKDGVPTYTDQVMDKGKNGGVSINQAIAKYARSVYSGPFEQDANYITQVFTLPQQIEAVKLWSNTKTGDFNMPLISLTAEETDEYSKIITDINTYREEATAKIISGQMGLDQIDTYYETLKSMGIDRALEIQQKAYDRFLAR